jgi:hypothetical protein
MHRSSTFQNTSTYKEGKWSATDAKAKSLVFVGSPEAGYVSHLETIQENSSNDRPGRLIILAFVDGIPFAITNIRCLGGARNHAY